MENLKVITKRINIKISYSNGFKSTGPEHNSISDLLKAIIPLYIIDIDGLFSRNKRRDYLK